MNVWYLGKHKITYLSQLFLLVLDIIFSFIPIISSTSISADWVVVIGKNVRIIQLAGALSEANIRTIFSFIILSLFLVFLLASIILLFFNIQKISYLTIMFSALLLLIDYFTSQSGLYVFQLIASIKIIITEITLIILDRRVYPYIRKSR